MGERIIYKQNEIQAFKSKYPLLKEITELTPVLWLNPNLNNAEKLQSVSLNRESIDKAEKLWNRFAPFLMKEFPETKGSGGIIESPLRELPSMKRTLEDLFSFQLEGDLLLKCDNELSIAGSIKARGGFYEILHYAESLALQEGLLCKEEESYEIFSNPEFKELFKQYSIGVGSTGNLGLSIGIMSAKLGFNVSVYMSADAKPWKKDLLREKGATVYEIEGDFSKAVDAGRMKTNADPKGYFVDDENSEHLFIGYSTVASRLKNQLTEKGILVDHEHPLFVYLPCGVGGAPGGITFGIKEVFGDNVHCFFAEPVHSPAVLIGLLTEEKEKISVQDFGLNNQTEADGLAVGRPSSFATTISDQLVSGVYTVRDSALLKLLSLLYENEDIFLEPSATAGFVGPAEVLHSSYLKDHNIDPKKATHIVWATGGGLVPEEERKIFYDKGNAVLNRE